MNNEQIETQPIYIVISQNVNYYYLYIRRIIKSIPCDVSTYNEIYNREVKPIVDSQIGIYVDLFTREPNNIIKEMAEKNVQETH